MGLRFGREVGGRRTLGRALAAAAVAAMVGLAAVPAPPAAAAGGGFNIDATRFAGADRYDTSARLAEAAYPHGSSAVVLASGANWPDALAGQFLAANLAAPVLLTTPTLPLSPYTTAALVALGARRAYLLGGPAAVSDAEMATLESLGLAVTRLYDSDGCGSSCNRYDTMAGADLVPGLDSVGTGVGGGPTAIVATGDVFADAVSAGPLSYARRFPIVLTDGASDRLVPQARSVLSRLGIKDAIVMGGTSAVSAGIASELGSMGITVDYRAAGADRTQTALDLAAYESAHYGFSATAFDLASGANFPDALSGAAFGALDPAPTLLTEPGGTLGPYLGAYLESGSGHLSGGYAFGGPAALPPSLLDQLGAAAEAGLPSITTTSLPEGALGQLYKAEVGATGGVAPYSWSLASGSLPAGLALDPSSGTISGLPTQTGTTSFSLRVTDADGGSASAPESITVSNFPVLNPLPGSGSGSGSASTGSLEVVIGAAPPGLTPRVTVSGPGGYSAGLSSSRTLTGLAPGTYSVSLASGQAQVAGTGGTWYSQVSGSPAAVAAGRTAQAQVSWSDVLDTAHVVGASDISDMTIATCSLPSGATGTQVSFDPVPADVAGLGPGDTLSIGPTQLTPGGFLGQIVSVSGSAGAAPLEFCTQPAELSDVAPQGSFDAAGTLGPGCVSGSLPSGSGSGFTLSPGTGACPYDPPAGAPLARPRARRGPGARPAASRAVRAHQSLGGFTGSFGTGTANGTEPGFGCGAAPPLAITGGINFTPSVNFSASWGALSGLQASVSASVTEQLSVGLTAEALASCQAQIPLLEDPIEYDCFDVQVGPVPVVVCPELQLYLFISVSGSVSSLQESFTQTATVGAGLSISCGISGCSSNPESTYTNSFSTHQSTAPETAVDIKVAVGPELEFLVYDVGGPEVDLAGFGELSISPSAYLANQPWWTLSGGLEAGAGVTLNLGGVIPVASINDPGILSVSSIFAQAPSGPPPPPVPTASAPGLAPDVLPAGTVGVPYSYDLSATGGAPPYTWSATSLPAGLSLDPATGQISGTPTQQGSFRVPLTLADQIASVQGHTVTQDDTLVISGPQITTSSLPAAEVGLAYSARLAATGGVCAQGASPPCVSWSVSPALPDGLSLDASGVISGTPAADAAGSYALTLTAADADQNSTQATLDLVVHPALAVYANGFGTSLSPHAEAAVTYSGVVEVNPFTGDGPYQWSGSGLPSWLVLACPGGALTCDTVNLSGTPSSGDVGTTTDFRVVATDALGARASEAFSVQVFSGVAITTAYLAEADAGVAYRYQVTATGGVQPYSWSLTGAPGLSVSGTSSPATISGTAPAAGSYDSVALSIRDSAGGQDALSLDLVVNPKPAVATSSLPDAPIGQYYVTDLEVSGGSAPFTWSLSQGALPAGLSLGPSGEISGQIASGAIDQTFTVKVTDAWGQTASRSLSITVPLGITTPGGALQDGYAGVAYATPCGGNGQALDIGAAGGAPAYTWSLSAGSLPAGLSLDPATGLISGTPRASAVGSTSDFTVTVTDAKAVSVGAAYSITVYPDATVVSAVSPAVGGTIGGNQVVITGSGFCGPGVSVSFGSVPAASVTVDSDTELTVTTPPAAAGEVTVGVSGYLGAAVPGPQSAFTYYTTPVLSSASLLYTGGSEQVCSYPSGSCETDGVVVPLALQLVYNEAVGATGALGGNFTVSGYHAVFTTSAAPGGTAGYYVQGSPLTCTLSPGDSFGSFGDDLFVYVAEDPCIDQLYLGNPSFSFTYTPSATQNVYNTYPPVYSPATGGTVSVDEADSVSCSTSCFMSGGPYIVGATIGPVPAEVGVGVNWQATGVVRVPPADWGIYGLPPGTRAGAPSYSGAGTITTTVPITGAPTQAGTYHVSACLGDGSLSTCSGFGNGPEALGQVTVEPAVSVATTSLPAATAGASYSQTLSAAGGVPVSAGGFDTWSIVPGSGSLPPGLSLDPFTGVVAGVPSYPVCSGSFAPPDCSYAFTVEVSDAYGVSATQALSIGVEVSPLALSTRALPEAVAGSPYAATLGATGGLAPYRFSATGLPADLSLDPSTGQITGTPGPADAAGSPYTVQVSATDQAGHTTQHSFSLAVAGTGLSITTTSLPTGFYGVPYSATVSAAGGVAPYRWSYDTTGDLFGEGYLQLTPEATSGTSATLTGTPALTGQMTVELSVTDAAGATAQASLSLSVVNGPLTITTTSLAAARACSGTTYTAAIDAAGGQSPYTWSLAAGSGPLPPGLSLESGSGNLSGGIRFAPRGTSGSGGGLPSSGSAIITGQPSASGSYPITVEVKDSAGASATQSYTLVVSATALSITTSSLPGAVVFQAYSATLGALGGACSSYTWSATGLPAGLSLDTSTGQITGTPGSGDAGSSPYRVSVTVTDAKGAQTSATLSLTVSAACSALRSADHTFTTSPC